ncbi:MAG: ATPase, partial [Nitrospiraceae bacterium]|nr:ATPase [Nitrospiraceae bacterium]
ERLPAQIEVALYRIAQEAITNVVRHAGASQISMILLRQTDEVSLIVEDDGNGFEMDSVDQEGHRPLGLMGMRERASLVGGEFVMASIPGKGVTIRVRIGLDKEGHANQDSDSG